MYNIPPTFILYFFMIKENPHCSFKFPENDNTYIMVEYLKRNFLYFLCAVKFFHRKFLLLLVYIIIYLGTICFCYRKISCKKGGILKPVLYVHVHCKYSDINICILHLVVYPNHLSCERITHFDKIFGFE